jgi:plastocyanin
MKATNIKALTVGAAAVWLSAGLPSLPREQSPEPPASKSDADNSAAAKAAARKKRFEEEKQRLEGREPAQSVSCEAGKPTLYITPAEAGMLVGESRGFALFDTDGHKLTKVAEWSVSSSYQATLIQGDEPTVTAKSEGTFKVTARIDTRTAEATVKVYPGDQLPIGAVRWRVAQIPCAKNGVISKSVQAVPH